ncbi:transporter [Nitrosovibrio sp. Nv6]|uniref:transporter n=1 Tax=Nitrosovibrio sp. Nv6 TaxID=1855340 RepID=UPI0018F40B4F|nr:transporter [Nitrosovibrio sp. Nv6]
MHVSSINFSLRENGMNCLASTSFTAFISIDWADANHDVCLQASNNDKGNLLFPHQVLSSNGRTRCMTALGLSGYYLKQTTNDKLDGEAISPTLGPWSPGRKGEVFAIGPGVSYNSPTGTMFIAQWQHEMHVENRFLGYISCPSDEHKLSSP